MRVFGENAECKGVNIAIQYTVCDGNAAATMYWEPARQSKLEQSISACRKLGATERDGSRSAADNSVLFSVHKRSMMSEDSSNVQL